VLDKQVSASSVDIAEGSLIVFICFFFQRLLAHLQAGDCRNLPTTSSDLLLRMADWEILQRAAKPLGQLVRTLVCERPFRSRPTLREEGQVELLGRRLTDLARVQLCQTATDNVNTIFQENRKRREPGGFRLAVGVICHRDSKS